MLYSSFPLAVTATPFFVVYLRVRLGVLILAKFNLVGFEMLTKLVTTTFFWSSNDSELGFFAKPEIFKNPRYDTVLCGTMELMS